MTAENLQGWKGISVPWASPRLKISGFKIGQACEMDLAVITLGVPNTYAQNFTRSFDPM